MTRAHHGSSLVTLNFTRKKWDFAYTVRQSLINWPLSRGYFIGSRDAFQWPLLLKRGWNKSECTDCPPWPLVESTVFKLIKEGKRLYMQSNSSCGCQYWWGEGGWKSKFSTWILSGGTVCLSRTLGRLLLSYYQSMDESAYIPSRENMNLSRLPSPPPPPPFPLHSRTLGRHLCVHVQVLYWRDVFSVHFQNFSPARLGYRDEKKKEKKKAQTLGTEFNEKTRKPPWKVQLVLRYLVNSCHSVWWTLLPGFINPYIAGFHVIS